ncbi:MAG: YdcF family protein [Sphingobacteriia bacterium]|nr:MAG: YdcF family protein [Sphingobacteriia bacterium]TAG30035.1 MAG: YdcF family protein [Sphingobacteriia bacterium]TAH06256.1 MAG: YdcF family protein [Sphingobacteriia bacterium]
MFFILSKILFFLLAPFHWILLLLIAYFLLKQESQRKKIKIAILVVLIVFTNPYLNRSVVKWWQPPVTQIPVGKTFSAGILLGGMSMFDRFDTGYFGNTSDRFIQTTNLYHSGVIKKILISGGTGSLIHDEPAEAHFLLKELLRNGVKQEDIIVEERARNTHENAVFSKALLDSLLLKPPYIIITSSTHMPRSIRVFKKAGFNDFIGYPCDYKVIDSKFELDDIIIPDIKLLDEWKHLFKEMIGIIAYQLTGKA